MVEKTKNRSKKTKKMENLRIQMTANAHYDAENFDQALLKEWRKSNVNKK